MTAPGSRINQRFDRELTIYPILFPFSSSNCFVDSPPILNEMELQGGNGDNQEMFNYPPNEIYNLDPKRILNVEKWEKKKSLTQYVLNAQLHNYRYYILTFVFKRIYSHDCFSSSRSLLSSCSFGETFFPQSIGASSLPILQHAALLPHSLPLPGQTYIQYYVHATRISINYLFSNLSSADVLEILQKEY